MSATVLRIGEYWLYFFSREEEGMHVHVVSADGEAKFWIEPIISLANYTGFNKRQLTHLHKLVEEHRSETVKAWRDYFRV